MPHSYSVKFVLSHRLEAPHRDEIWYTKLSQWKSLQIGHSLAAEGWINTKKNNGLLPVVCCVSDIC